jgi:hypothetical protein
MNIESKDIIEAIQKAGKVDTVEKLLWDIKGSIKQDIQAIALQTKQDILHANQLQVEQIKSFVTDVIASNNEKNLKPIREDVIELKSDRKAVKWIVVGLTGAITTVWNVAKEYLK